MRTCAGTWRVYGVMQDHAGVVCCGVLMGVE